MSPRRYFLSSLEACISLGKLDLSSSGEYGSLMQITNVDARTDRQSELPRPMHRNSGVALSDAGQVSRLDRKQRRGAVISQRERGRLDVSCWRQHVVLRDVKARAMAVKSPRLFECVSMP